VGRLRISQHLLDPRHFQTPTETCHVPRLCAQPIRAKSSDFWANCLPHTFYQCQHAVDSAKSTNGRCDEIGRQLQANCGAAGSVRSLFHPPSRWIYQMARVTEFKFSFESNDLMLFAGNAAVNRSGEYRPRENACAPFRAWAG